MALATTATWTLNRDELIAQGLMMSGQLNASQQPDEFQIALGKSILSSGLLGLQARGIFLRSVDRFPQALTIGLASYACSADTIDVEKDAIIRTPAGLDIPILKMGREEYQAKSDKTIQNQPTNFYAEESAGGTITIYLYPSPDLAYTLYYPRVRRLRDLDVGTANIDASPVWLDVMKWMLAWQFSVHYKQTLERATLLKGYYDDAASRAMDDETPRGPSRMVVDPIFPRYA